jgi:hypothetical protein
LTAGGKEEKKGERGKQRASHNPGVYCKITDGCMVSPTKRPGVNRSFDIHG